MTVARSRCPRSTPRIAAFGNDALRRLALALVVAAFCSPVFAAPGEQAAGTPAPTTETPPAKPKIVRNPAFYTADVTLRSQGEKRGGLIRAFNQVVVRLTGDPDAPNNAVVRRAASGVEALVQKSATRQEQETVNGLPVYKTILGVAFDPAAVDNVIGAAGLKFWTSARPKPILWLAIDDGRGPRLVTGQQPNVVKPLAVRGLERGMRFLLPSGNAVETAAVPAIWRLDAAALQPLTARYRNDAQLVGKVYRLGAGWAADWILSESGVELARWSFADTDPRRTIASGVDSGANALARRDAVGLDTGTAGMYAVDIDGIGSQGDYLRLMAYLQSLPVVRRVAPVEAGPGMLRLQLELGVGMKGFNSMVASGSTLRADADAGAGAAHFTLQ
jgi:hypothetical protein